MGLVGQVILNRVKSTRYPDNIKEVVLQDKQFSCWNDPTSNNDNSYKIRLKDLSIKYKTSYNKSKETAEKVLNGGYENEIPEDTLHFIAVNHNRIRIDGERIISAYVSWAVGAEIVFQADHYFLRGVS